MKRLLLLTLLPIMAYADCTPEPNYVHRKDYPSGAVRYGSTAVPVGSDVSTVPPIGKDYNTYTLNDLYYTKEVCVSPTGRKRNQYAITDKLVNFVGAEPPAPPAGKACQLDPKYQGIKLLVNPNEKWQDRCLYLLFNTDENGVANVQMYSGQYVDAQGNVSCRQP